jgi:hypothetical protein
MSESNSDIGNVAPNAELVQMAMSYSRSCTLCAAARLGVADALGDEVRGVDNLAETRPMVDFLTQPEIKALLAAPNRNTWLGRRDHALLLTAARQRCQRPVHYSRRAGQHMDSGKTRLPLLYQRQPGLEPWRARTALWNQHPNPSAQ